MPSSSRIVIENNIWNIGNKKEYLKEFKISIKTHFGLLNLIWAQEPKNLNKNASEQSFFSSILDINYNATYLININFK